MPEERKKIEVTLGAKGEKPSAGQDVKKGQKPETEGEVGGRYLRANWVNCPFCYSNNLTMEETTIKLAVECWNCHNIFWHGAEGAV